MNQSKYKLIYSPLFYSDLRQVIEYISVELKAPDTAMEYLNRIEAAIIKRAEFAESFPIYPGTENRPHPYRTIRVGNYLIFYVLYEDFMEVRRLIYNKRDISRLL